MKRTVNNEVLYAYTGGKDYNPDLPTMVFIHGVLNDHSVWALQSRYFANHGFNVLAIDLPGHGRSSGAPPASVAEAAASVLGLLDDLQVTEAVLVGHSWGSLIALHAASLDPQRVVQVVLVGTAFPMPVSPALLEMSVSAPDKAIDMVNTFSHSTLCAAVPGQGANVGSWTYGGARALMQHVLASNRSHNVFNIGFNACNSYATGLEDMARVSCPVTFVLGSADQMTPPKAARSLIGAAGKSQVFTLPAGHSLMTEAPDGVLRAIQAAVKGMSQVRVSA